MAHSEAGCPVRVQKGQKVKMPLESFNQYLLSTYYVPSTVAVTGDIAVSKIDKNACFMELAF